MNALGHERLQDLVLAHDEATGIVFGFSKSSPLDENLSFVAFGGNEVASELRNLIIAAPILYQTISDHLNSLQLLLSHIDTLPQTKDLEALHNSFTTMQNSLMLAQQVAQIGMPAVVKQLNAANKTKG